MYRRSDRGPVLSVPPTRYIFNPTNTEVAQLSTTWRRAVPGMLLQVFIPIGEQPKNSAVALSLRNNMIHVTIHQRSARTNESKTKLILSYSRTVSWMVSSFSASCSWRPLDWRIRHNHLTSTLFHSLVPWWRPRRIRPQITRLSQLENSAMGTWPLYKNSIIPDCFEKLRDIKFWYMC